VPPRTPPFGSLVDYEDEDDSFGGPGAPADEPVSAIRSSSPSSSTQNQIALKPSPPISEVPPRQVTPSKSTPQSKHPSSTCSSTKPTATTPEVVDADDADDFINILSASSKQPPSPASSPSLPSDMSGTKSFFGHMRSSEKRRREEDDDGLLERLNKSKKPQLGSTVQKDDGSLAGRTGDSIASAAATTKAGDGHQPPKKFKLKLGPTSLGVTGSPSPAENEPQNRDTG
jgi:protein phosphatase-4 regulatory subunit 3